MGKEQSNKRPEVTNNLHVCNETQIALDDVGKSLMDSSLTTDEIALVWDFYVSHAPVKKNKNNDKGMGCGLRHLGEYGWNGKADLSTLEREMIKIANLGHLVVIKANKVTETLTAMNLGCGEKICWKHPRAVIKQMFSVEVKENSECQITEKESRMVCFFRHVRNALAHNRIYYSPDGEMMLLEDVGDGSQISARILIPTIALVNWIRVIDKNHIFYFKTSDESKENILKNVVAS